ncbi:MAG: class I SAM-dependent methyltransferase [Planctomycetota bacterium]
MRLAEGFLPKNISWQDDYQDRMNPKLMTRLLRKAIPVLQNCEWTIDELRDGYAETTLPLSAATTNQHGTHQAALISLSADYTGGLAVSTLLRGVPIGGVHPCNDNTSVALWLASMNVKYLSPSTGHLVGRCHIDERTKTKILNRYDAGKRVLVSLPVTFESNGETIAEADMKYFLQPTATLAPTVQNPRVTPLFSNKLKASARMISGLRAQAAHSGSRVQNQIKDDDRTLRVDSPHEAIAAGPHGKILAERLGSVLPQLRNMVMARTAHLDEFLRSINGLEQIINLGVGLDMRAFRMRDDLGDPVHIELDLSEMLAERERVIDQMNHSVRPKRYTIAANFRTDNVAELIARHPAFDPQKCTAVIYEGISMYFSEAENTSLLGSLKPLLRHPSSQLWCDLVDARVIADHPDESLKRFLEGMEELGERFIFGHSDAQQWLEPTGLRVNSAPMASEVLNWDDPIYNLYRFVTSTWNAKPASGILPKLANRNPVLLDGDFLNSNSHATK